MSENATILVVDDDSGVRGVLEGFLKAEGYLTETAEDGFAALALFEKTQIDVALVDLQMPGMDGVELCRRIKERNPETQVIIVTGAGSRGSAIAVLRGGAFDYILKPPDPMEIYHSVEQALEKQQLLAEKELFVQELSVVNEKRRQRERELEKKIEDLEILNRSLTQDYEEVRAFQDALHYLLDRVNHAVLFSELDGAITEINAKAKELFGYSRDQFLEMKLCQLTPQSFSERTEEMLKRLRMGLSDSFEAEVCTKNKETLRLEWNASVVEREKKRVALIFLREPPEKIEERIEDSEEEHSCTPNTGS